MIERYLPQDLALWGQDANVAICGEVLASAAAR
jgi:hypothetical protein